MSEEKKDIRPISTIHMIDTPTIPCVESHTELIDKWEEELAKEKPGVIHTKVFSSGEIEGGAFLASRVEYILEVTPEVWRARQEDEIRENQMHQRLEAALERVGGMDRPPQEGFDAAG